MSTSMWVLGDVVGPAHNYKGPLRVLRPRDVVILSPSPCGVRTRCKFSLAISHTLAVVQGGAHTSSWEEWSVLLRLGSRRLLCTGLLVPEYKRFPRSCNEKSEKRSCVQATSKDWACAVSLFAFVQLQDLGKPL
jgi:hypothetical protein